jgi:hypothetical protein
MEVTDKMLRNEYISITKATLYRAPPALPESVPIDALWILIFHSVHAMMVAMMPGYTVSAFLESLNACMEFVDMMPPDIQRKVDRYLSLEPRFPIGWIGCTVTRFRQELANSGRHECIVQLDVSLSVHYPHIREILLQM